MATFDVSTVTLATSRILNEKGESIVMGSLWGQNPVILIFLKHFACISCRAHAKDVWTNREKYEQAGAKLHFIGNGAPFAIQTFKEDLKLEGSSIFTDPSLKTFNAAGFKRGILRALGPQSIVNAVKLYKEGNVQTKHTKDKGDLWQLGGILAVKPGGVVTYQYISESTGDFPPESDLALLEQA